MTRPTSTPTWGGTQTEPSGGQKTAGFAPGDRPPAQWLNWLLDNFADWINYLDVEHLRDVTQALATIPVFGSSSQPDDQPASGSNVWKPCFAFTCNDGRRIRLFVGRGDTTNDAYILTFNAAWDPSVAQVWSQDNGTGPSSALWLRGEELRVFGKAAGAGTWAATAWDTTRGSLSVGNDLAVGDDVLIGGDLTLTGSVVGNLTATGTVQGADVIATDDLSCGDDLVVGDNITMGGELSYPTPKSRVTFVPLASGFGEGLIATGGGLHITFTGAGDVHVWPIVLPQSALITGADVLCVKAGVGTVRWSLLALGGHDWANATPAYLTTETELAFDTEGAAGEVTPAFSFGGLGVDNNALDGSAGTDMYLRFVSGDGGDEVWGLRIYWTDQGPRNF